MSSAEIFTQHAVLIIYVSNLYELWSDCAKTLADQSLGLLQGWFLSREIHFISGLVHLKN